MPRIKSVRIDLQQHPLSGFLIADIPASARLVILVGPNGSGKTSLFDALKNNERKGGVVPQHHLVYIECHNPNPSHTLQLYMRTAYRTEHVLSVQAGLMIIPHQPDGSSGPRPTPSSRAPDRRVAFNFQKLLHKAHSIAMTDSGKSWTDAVKDLFAPINERLKHIFPYLEISDIRYPTGGNNSESLETLCFNRSGTQYRYEFLSAGEKEVFDLLFDLEMWAEDYPDALYCIDEPELHLHSALQSALLDELMSFIPAASQLWIATHSVGIIRKAMDMYLSKPSDVVFLEFPGGDLTRPQKKIAPAVVDRSLWKRVLGVALHDVADLVCPNTLVICEGRPLGTGNPKSAEFDSKIYRRIFHQSRPDTDFISGGGCSQVENDMLKLAASFKSGTPGIKIIQLLDRDNKSPDEIADRQKVGIRVLSRYSIENYLWSDEILNKMLTARGCESEASRILALKRDASLQEDKLEPIRDKLHVVHAELKKLPSLRGTGSDIEAFGKYVLAELITKETDAYKELDRDIFG